MPRRTIKTRICKRLGNYNKKLIELLLRKKILFSSRTRYADLSLQLLLFLMPVLGQKDTVHAKAASYWPCLSVFPQIHRLPTAPRPGNCPFEAVCVREQCQVCPGFRCQVCQVDMRLCFLFREFTTLRSKRHTWVPESRGLGNGGWGVVEASPCYRDAPSTVGPQWSSAAEAGLITGFEVTRPRTY